jgi:hypothetical protein
MQARIHILCHMLLVPSTPPPLTTTVAVANTAPVLWSVRVTVAGWVQVHKASQLHHVVQSAVDCGIYFKEQEPPWVGDTAMGWSFVLQLPDLKHTCPKIRNSRFVTCREPSAGDTLPPLRTSPQAPAQCVQHPTGQSQKGHGRVKPWLQGVARVGMWVEDARHQQLGAAACCALLRRLVL